MRSTVSLLFGVILLILPGLFISSVGGTSLVLIFGVLEIAFALGSIVYAIKPGRKNPLKFLAFLPVILLIVFSKGYAARYIPIAIGMPPTEAMNRPGNMRNITPNSKETVDLIFTSVCL